MCTSLFDCCINVDSSRGRVCLRVCLCACMNACMHACIYVCVCLRGEGMGEHVYIYRERGCVCLSPCLFVLKLIHPGSVCVCVCVRVCV